MVNLAITVLSVLAGIWAAVASYSELNEHLLAVLALIGCVAVGIIVGALFYAVATWLFGELNTKV